MIYNVRQCQTSVRKMSDELQTTVKHVLNNYKTKFIILIFFANDIQCQTMSNNVKQCQTSVRQCQTMSNNVKQVSDNVKQVSNKCQTVTEQVYHTNILCK